MRVLKNKRGVSAVVATVLIILMTVGAVAIVWAVVMPMIRDSLDFSSLEGRISILTSGGYTAYDSVEKIAMVQVKRDVDEGVMNRIKIIFNILGSSYSSVVVAPESGGTKTYYFDLSDYGEPDSVAVAPIFVSSSGKEKEGDVMSEVSIPKSRISDLDVNVYYLGSDYNYTVPPTAKSCLDLYNNYRIVDDGVYWIKVGDDSIQVYCDMTTDGGGWTLITVCRPEGNPNYPSYNSAVSTSGCWETNAVGETTNPGSTTTTKLSDDAIRKILSSGEKTTRGHWTQTYRYNTYSPVDIYIYNLFVDPSEWNSAGNTNGNEFYVKYSYGSDWGSLLTTYSSGCSGGSNGWSNQNYDGHGESCGSYGAWYAGCEKGPSASHCCACVTYDERANVVVYAK